MIHWLWLIPAATFGGIIGVVLMAMLYINRLNREDEEWVLSYSV